MATAKRSKSRKSAAAKSKTKRAAPVKSRATSSRAKASAKTRRSKSLSAAARRAAAARSARAKKPAARKAAPAKSTARRPAAKRAAPKKTIGRVSRAAPRPMPAPAPAPSVDVIPPLATAVPAVEPRAEPAGGPGTGDGEAEEEDGPGRLADGREAVASFATRAQFRDAVKQLLAAGFAPTDLSVLASHDSLEVAGGVPAYPDTPERSLRAGLTEDVNFIGPLQIAGFSALSGGPIGAAFAALVTAGLGGMALRDIVGRFVANRHGTAFAEALEAGAVLLWARVDDVAREQMALGILRGCGGGAVHINARRADGRASALAPRDKMSAK